MLKNLTLKSPWILRFLGWMKERFPIENGILFFVLYLTAVALGRTFATETESLFKMTDIFGCIASWTFFLLLRIYDEHKDYEIDCQNYPERVLQKGLITLKDLKIIGFLCITYQLIYCLYLDRGIGPVTLTWVCITAYSFLMTVEFFIGEWLSKRLVLYALSHMIIMPMIIFWLVSMGIGKSPFIYEINLFSILAFFSGFSFEITRKTRAPEEERDTVDSYSKIMGIKGCVSIIISLLVGIGFLGKMLVNASTKQPFQGVYLFYICLIVSIGHLLYFTIKPSLKGRERNEALVGTGMLSVYATLIWALVRG